MDKFTIYNLEINEKNKILVMKYLQSIKNHVEKNWLDYECYEDIEEMFFEKLSSLKQINELNIKKIIQEVWEAEIIFWESQQKINSNKDNLNFYQKLKINSWEYQNDNAIVLWISSLLAKKIGLSVWIIRIILLFLIIFWWLSIWLYFLLWLILPVKTLDYNSSNLTNLIKNQLFYVIKKSIKNIIKSIFLFFPFIFNKIYLFIVFLLKNILPILRVLFFNVLWLILLFLVFFLIFILSLSFTNFTIWNLDFFYAMPNYLNFWLIVWIISLSTFSINSFVYAVKRKNINLYILSTWFITFIIALFLCFSTIFDLIWKYSNAQTFTQKSTIQLEELWEYWIYFNNKSIVSNSSFLWLGIYRYNNPIKLVKHDSNEIILEVITNFYWNEEIKKAFEKWLSEIILTKNENKNIFVNYKNDDIFSKKVPFTPISQEFILYVPEGFNFSLFGNSFYYENAFLSTKYDVYSNYVYSWCKTFSQIYYSQDEWFVCDLSQDSIDYAKRELVRYSLVKNFDNISAIHHKDEYKRSYWFWDNIYSDWRFDDIEFIGDDKMSFKFFDNSIEVQAIINYIIQDNKLEINNFEIKNIKINENIYKDKYYKNPDLINEFNF